jgi:hypothetical protein
VGVTLRAALDGIKWDSDSCTEGERWDEVRSSGICSRKTSCLWGLPQWEREKGGRAVFPEKRSFAVIWIQIAVSSPWLPRPLADNGGLSERGRDPRAVAGLAGFSLYRYIQTGGGTRKAMDTGDIARAQAPLSFRLRLQTLWWMCPHDIRGSTELKHHSLMSPAVARHQCQGSSRREGGDRLPVRHRLSVGA